MMMINNKIETIGVISKTKKCIVWKIKHKNEVFALKVPFKEVEVKTEYDILLKICRKNINNCSKLWKLAFIKYENVEYKGLLLDYYEVNSMPFRLNSLFFNSPKSFKKFARSIIETVRDLHKIDIIHCDIKPSNIMVTNDHTPVLIDFGSSIISGNRSGQYRTTQIYRAPERFVDITTPINATHDVFSIGCLLYFYYTGEQLFIYYKNDDDDRILKSRMNVRIKLKMWFSNVELLEDLIEKMVEFDTSKRIDMDSCLKHKFFN